MATSGRGSGVVGYNVRVAVDTEHHLIATHEVTNTGSDRSQLAKVAKEAKAILQVQTLDAVADRGYFNGEEILACDQAGITVTLPKPMTSGAKSEGRFGKQDFVYLPAEDVYRCPADERLKYYYTNVENGLTLRRLDDRVSDLPPQAPLHDRRATPNHPMGTRACALSRAEEARRKSAGHASAARDGRAPLRHDQGAHGRDALPDEDVAEGRQRDGAQRARLQSDARYEHPRHQAADRGD
jgi:hypothetical protein